MNITLYSSPTCPKCKVLKMKLQEVGVEFVEEHDISYLDGLGVRTLPQLKIEGQELMDFGAAIKYCKTLKGE